MIWTVPKKRAPEVFASQDTLEAYQLVDDDLGRLVQWTVGSPQDRGRGIWGVPKNKWGYTMVHPNHPF